MAITVPPVMFSAPPDATEIPSAVRSSPLTVLLVTWPPLTLSVPLPTLMPATLTVELVQFTYSPPLPSIVSVVPAAIIIPSAPVELTISFAPSFSVRVTVPEPVTMSGPVIVTVSLTS